MGDACCAHDEPAEADASGSTVGRFWQIREVKAAAVSGSLLAAGLGGAAVDSDAPANAAYLGALLVGGWTFVPGTVRGLLRGRLGVGTLMTIAAIGAVALGELGEAASLAFLFSISEALEGYALARTRRGLRALLALVPERVTVRKGHGELVIDPADLVVGDAMIVGPGDRLATDGVVRTGRSTLDLSALTGESVPVEIEPGREVFAAAINGGGVLEVEVTACTADSSLARVVHIVEEDGGEHGDRNRDGERTGRRRHEDHERPPEPQLRITEQGPQQCDGGRGHHDPGHQRLGHPVLRAVGSLPSVPGRASARMGALVKGGRALEALSRVRVVALDKTGTLTRNRPEVVEVVVAGTADRRGVLRVAAALEARSGHPLAAAIGAAAADVPEASDVQAVTGNGLTGVVGGLPARLGKPGFVAPGHLGPTVAALQAEGSTVVLVEYDGALLGAVAVHDQLRPEAAAVVSALRRRLGIERIVMLTGDNRRTADAIGRQAGIDEVHAELLPEDKVRIVGQLRASGATAMVGDGINDAPALATAEVGIAMGAMGSDVAIEAADVALMGEDLAHLPEVLAHARRAGRIMRQNLALSGAILAVLVPLAAFGILGLATVVATHELAEVLVIANGVRAGRPGRFSRPEPASVGSEIEQGDSIVV